jgi:hypothetical protein
LFVTIGRKNMSGAVENCGLAATGLVELGIYTSTKNLSGEVYLAIHSPEDSWTFALTLEVES